MQSAWVTAPGNAGDWAGGSLCMSQRLLLNPMTESYFSCWGTAGNLATGVLSSYFLVSAHVYIGRHVGGSVRSVHACVSTGIVYMCENGHGMQAWAHV